MLISTHNHKFIKFPNTSNVHSIYQPTDILHYLWFFLNWMNFDLFITSLANYNQFQHLCSVKSLFSISQSCKMSKHSTKIKSLIKFFFFLSFLFFCAHPIKFCNLIMSNLNISSFFFFCSMLNSYINLTMLYVMYNVVLSFFPFCLPWRKNLIGLINFKDVL